MEGLPTISESSKDRAKLGEPRLDGVKQGANDPSVKASPESRSYVSLSDNPAEWIREPDVFEEGETVLLVVSGKSAQGPYVIQTVLDDGWYKLHRVDRMMYKDELKRPDYQQK